MLKNKLITKGVDDVLINSLLDDYYKGKLKIGDIANLVGENKYYVRTYFKRNNIATINKYLELLDFDDKDLKRMLSVKYNSIVSRCNGNQGDTYGHYFGMGYLSVIDYIKFCNEKSETLIKMWKNYHDNNKSLKYAISIDRIENNQGYIIGNIQFVTHGLNSWKRNLTRPVKVTFNNESYYFMSCQEASRFFGVRERLIGEYFRKERRDNEFIVEIIDLKLVLEYRECNTIEEYYDKYIK